MFAFFYRFFLEGTLELSISVGITLAMMKSNYWTSYGMFISSFFCIANLLVLIGMPMLTLWISINYHKRQKTDQDFKKKYEFMFEEMET